MGSRACSPPCWRPASRADQTAGARACTDSPEPKPWHSPDTEFGEKWKRDLRTSAAGGRGRVFQDRRNSLVSAHTISTCKHTPALPHDTSTHMHTRAPKPSGVAELTVQTLAAHKARLGSRAARGTHLSGGHPRGLGGIRRQPRVPAAAGRRHGQPYARAVGKCFKMRSAPFGDPATVLWDLSPHISSRMCCSQWHWWLE